MATRIVFQPSNAYPWFRESVVTFEWVPGLARTQAQKSIRNLHLAAKTALSIDRILEVSTKSEEILGQKLSAFNLRISDDAGNYSLESAYQASKVFERSVQYPDLLFKDAVEAKRDIRLRSSGALTGFRFRNQNFQLTSSPNFYDYLYVCALLESGLENDLIEYQGFTDHAFSGDGKIIKGKSVNCQARSLAIFTGMREDNPAKDILEILLNEASRAMSHEQAELFDL